MFDFKIYTLLITAISLWGIVWAIYVKKDIFHPLAYLMPMALYLYAYLPLELFLGDLVDLVPFTASQWAQVQLLNCLCVGSLVVGAVVGSRSEPIKNQSKIRFQSSDISNAYVFALIIGFVSVFAYAVNLNNVGGFFEAYSRVKGGGTASSGYVRDAIFWAIPAISTLAFCVSWDCFRLKYLVPAAIFAMPLLFTGLLSARRGPTFIIIVTLVASWYLARKSRPASVVFFAGGAALGLLLLLLVNFRGEFNLGGADSRKTGKSLISMITDLDDRQNDRAERNLGGNEFVYGANVILTFSENGEYLLGNATAHHCLNSSDPKATLADEV